MLTKKLHELIILANSGVNFRAKSPLGYFVTNKEFVDKIINNESTWLIQNITGDWKYEELNVPISFSFSSFVAA